MHECKQFIDSGFIVCGAIGSEDCDWCPNHDQIGEAVPVMIKGETITYEQLMEFAEDCDGECVVCLVDDVVKAYRREAFPVGITDRPWEYFFCDEAENFPYDEYKITGAPYERD